MIGGTTDEPTHHPRPAPLAAVAAGLAMAGTAVASAATGGASAADVCTADNLYVVKGRLEGAAGNRYLTVKLTNVGDDPCSAGTATKAGFRDWPARSASRATSAAAAARSASTPARPASAVVHWTDPGRCPADDCQEAEADLVTVRVPSLGTPGGCRWTPRSAPRASTARTPSPSPTEGGPTVRPTVGRLLRGAMSPRPSYGLQVRAGWKVRRSGHLEEAP